MFNKKDFLKALAFQCTTLNLRYGQLWALAPNVFAAMIKPIKGDKDWAVLFYFDDREVKMRDEASGKQQMAREIQLLMMTGFTIYRLSNDSENHVGIAHFNTDPTGYQSENVINCASQLFAKTDNSEISWLDYAEVLSAPLNKMVNKS